MANFVKPKTSVECNILNIYYDSDEDEDYDTEYQESSHDTSESGHIVSDSESNTTDSELYMNSSSDLNCSLDGTKWCGINNGLVESIDEQDIEPRAKDCCNDLKTLSGTLFAPFPVHDVYSNNIIYIIHRIFFVAGCFASKFFCPFAMQKCSVSIYFASELFCLSGLSDSINFVYLFGSNVFSLSIFGL